MPLQIAYSPLLVVASIAIAITAAFTALRMTSNLRQLDFGQRKTRITQGAFALGGGIWSMHFVGMMAVQFPITIAYDPLPTLASALIAILVVGAALLSLHFGVRTRLRIAIAGCLTGLGIVLMHYLGMGAISANCVVSYNPIGILVAIAISIGASTAALELAYGTRTLRATIAGGVVLGLAISAMHYSAMLFTTFSRGIEMEAVSGPLLSSDGLALIVTLSSFVICGLFLLSAVPSATANAEKSAVGRPAAAVALSKAGEGLKAPVTTTRIPYEQDNTVRSLSPETILTARADGHYTRLNNGKEELFCPWSISRLEKSLGSQNFMRVHRSFIVNRKRITGLKRENGKPFCVVGEETNIAVPVSRARVAELRTLLGMGQELATES
ncbi:MAG: MHYT domain-containing protein [Pseudomonadota bacterium]